MAVDVLLGGVVFEVDEVVGAGHQRVLAQLVGDGLGRLGGPLHAQLQIFQITHQYPVGVGVAHGAHEGAYSLDFLHY